MSRQVLLRQDPRRPRHTLFAAALGLWMLGGTTCIPDRPEPVEPPTEEVSGQPLPDDLPSFTIEGQGTIEPTIEGGLIILNAVADPGWRFEGWFGPTISTDNPLTLAADDAAGLGAKFIPESGSPPPDADADGVPDDLDDCPDTPVGAAVNVMGCGPSQFDTDRDLISDDQDQCPETRNGEEVDVQGCSALQRDQDNDGVSDATDRCANTRPEALVDSEGCSASQRDTDRDGVADEVDDCPQSPTDAVVDGQGCAASQMDGDDDGVTDDMDLCSETPSGSIADATGCASSQRDSDGDHVTDDLDRCPDSPPFQSVDPLGCPAAAVGPIGGSPTVQCGNGVVESAEECDPPLCNTCNPACQLIDSKSPGRWQPAFDTSVTGVLSAVWGSSPFDVFVVGGTDQQGEIHHFNGVDWAPMVVPPVPLLIWIYGFGPNDVYAVGLGGSALHYNGSTWNLRPTNTNVDLWGIWGPSPNDLWLVGGDAFEGEPSILHYDGNSFVSYDVPSNHRDAHALFKVWGIGSKVFAVGQNGLIVQFDGTGWVHSESGANEDFISLWGTSENHILAVGGRSGGQLAFYNGSGWTTTFLNDTPGLQSIFMARSNQAMLGGFNGFLAQYDPLSNTVNVESADTFETIHGLWSDCNGRWYGVGGFFNPPFQGIALVRTTQALLPLRVESASTDPSPQSDHRLGVVRDISAEASMLAACLFGPDVTPTPLPGQTALRCRNAFDYEDDGDVDLANVSVYASSLPPESPPRIELGLALFGERYEPLVENDEMPVFRGLQGGMHIFVSIRGFGFQPNNLVRITQSGVFVDNGQAAFQSNSGLTQFNGIGINRILNLFVMLCPPRPALCLAPGQADGREADLTFTVTDSQDPAITATLTQRVVFHEMR